VTGGNRVLLVIGADIQREQALRPRRDYAVAAARLNATILDRGAVGVSTAARALRRLGGPYLALAWLAFRRRRQFDVVVTDGEHIGIPLALLLLCSRSSTRHITIGHRLSSKKKRPFFRILGVQRKMDRILVHSRRQIEMATEQLHIAPDRLAMIPYQVDAEYWTPTGQEEEALVVSAGLEYRDYDTFFRAVTGLPAQVIVAAASPWSRHRGASGPQPENVEVRSFDYPGLRDLYARAAVVVVPLVDVDNQAGVTTILEAMAMGKAVIVSQSWGQTDVVEDRRGPHRGAPRPRPMSLLRAIAAEKGTVPESNGFYVPPGDAVALRNAIVYLLEHPEERAQLGRAGRRTVEQLLTVDLFAERIALHVQRCGPPPDAGRRLARAWHL